MLDMLVGCAIQAAAAVVYIAPLVILQTPGFDSAQQQNLARAIVNLSTEVFHTYLIFFGMWCVVQVYLIYWSTFLPRVLGVLLVLDGIGWMLYLYPPHANSIYPVIATMSGLAESPLLLWFLVSGVNNQRWTQRKVASQAAQARHLAAGLA